MAKRGKLHVKKGILIASSHVNTTELCPVYPEWLTIIITLIYVIGDCMPEIVPTNFPIKI